VSAPDANAAIGHPFLCNGRSDVLGHRGASHDRPPGNTMAAFRRTLEVGADHIETDVQAGADGRVVIFHDETLDDTTTGSGRVGEHSWEYLCTLLYRVEGVPTDDGLVLLDDALAEFPDAFFNIDVKTDATVRPAIEVLRSHGAARRVCVAAFGWRRQRRVRRDLGPGWCTAFSKWEIVTVRLAAWLRLPVPAWGDVVQLPPSRSGVAVVDRRLLDACHRRGVAVHVWTVNDPGQMERLRALGVDAIITDRPDLAL